MPRPHSKLQLRKRTEAEDYVCMHTTKQARCTEQLASPIAHGAVGLLNLGDTCYINAVIQALFYSPLRTELSAACKPWRQTSSPSPHPLVASLGRCFANMEVVSAGGRGIQSWDCMILDFFVVGRWV
jgi:hypothetical protein